MILDHLKRNWFISNYVPAPAKYSLPPKVAYFAKRISCVILISVRSVNLFHLWGKGYFAAIGIHTHTHTRIFFYLYLVLFIDPVCLHIKFFFIFFISMYHNQQNKCYPKRWLLAHLEATVDFSRSEFTCP